MICRQCEKEVTGEGIAFCPYCGARLSAAEKKPSSKEAEEWVRKALSVTSLPERKKILEKAKAACPDAPEIDWEMLFIGTPDPRPPKNRVDFSIIKSWLLHMYRKPGDFPEEKKKRMRQELFEGERLQAVLAASEDPEGKLHAYLDRLCTEYIDIFLMEDNQLMGTIFGIRMSRNCEKLLMEAAEEMARRIREDTELLPERRTMLAESLLRAAERQGKH